MKKIRYVFLILVLLTLPASGINHAQAAGHCSTINQVFDHIAVSDNGVCKVSIPRQGITVTLAGQKMPPKMVPLSYGAHFTQNGTRSVVIGEFALLENEVNPVIDILRQGGINISALHNHMIGEVPRIMYLHFQGTGPAEKLAKIVKSAIVEAEAVKMN